MPPQFQAETELLARSGQLLTTHLCNVVQNGRQLVPESATTETGDDLRTVVETIAQLHDFGKLTQWFQQHVRDDVPVTAPSSNHTNHGLLSAYVTLLALRKRGITRRTAIAGFYAVAKHHGVLPDVPSKHSTYTKGRNPAQEMFDRLDDQLQNIDNNTPEVADTILTDATNDALSWTTINSLSVREISLILNDKFDAADPGETFYATVERLWATLVCADKLDAAGVDLSEATKTPLEPTKIDRHFANQPEPTSSVQRELNTLRSQAQKDATERLLKSDKRGDQLFTLSLPTGFGKTFAGLRAALSLANTQNGTVIYALPFTTIIDQTHETITSIFDVSADADDNTYTIHHHLADTRTRLGDTQQDSVSDGSEMLYGETWQASLVLTTFVQLFESVAGPGNVQSVKLPALQDSVIVVDEPQAISPTWWNLISRLSRLLEREYDATLIFMTATPPKIIDNLRKDTSPTPLLPESQQYQGFLRQHERVSYTLTESVCSYLENPGGADPLPVAAAASLVCDAIDDETRTVLTVGNTVQSIRRLSAAITKELLGRGRTPLHLDDYIQSFYAERGRGASAVKALGPESLEGDARLEGLFEGTPALSIHSLATEFLSYVANETELTERTVATALLTTRLRPLDRTLLIEALRQILDDGTTTPFDDTQLITESTQLIEAGVDVSFDQLFRDFAPIPSIVQAAGRCNRAFEAGQSEVTIWRLAGEDDTQTPSDTIYDDRYNLLRPTRAALSRLNLRKPPVAVSEYQMVSDLVEAYYTQLHQTQISSPDSDILASHIDYARGEQLRQASLIEDTDYKSDAVIVSSDFDAALVDRYESAKHNQELGIAKLVFNMLKQLLVSIPEDELPNEVLEADDDRPFVVIDRRNSEFNQLR